MSRRQPTTLIQTLPRLEKDPKIVKWLSGIDGQRTRYRLGVQPVLPGMAWYGLVASSGERLARCWTWCAAIILPSYMLGGERYNLVVFYSLWYSLTHCTGGTVWWDGCQRAAWCQPGLRLGLTHSQTSTMVTLTPPIFWTSSKKDKLSYKDCYPREESCQKVGSSKCSWICPRVTWCSLHDPYSEGAMLWYWYRITFNNPSVKVLIIFFFHNHQLHEHFHLYDHLPYQEDECNRPIGGCGHLSETWRDVSESNLIVHTLHSTHYSAQSYCAHTTLYTTGFNLTVHTLYCTHRSAQSYCTFIHTHMHILYNWLETLKTPFRVCIAQLWTLKHLTRCTSVCVCTILTIHVPQFEGLTFLTQSCFIRFVKNCK